jgi:hypothetical protein
MTLHDAITHPDILAVSLACVAAACLIAINAGGAGERARKRRLVRQNKAATLLGAAILWSFTVAAQKGPTPPGPTNPPPAAARGVIRLHQDIGGRLIPIGAPVGEYKE